MKEYVIVLESKKSVGHFWNKCEIYIYASEIEFDLKKIHPNVIRWNVMTILINLLIFSGNLRNKNALCRNS